MTADTPPARVDLWEDRALIVAGFGTVSRHRHAAGVMLIGLDGDFRLGWQGRWCRTTSAYIPAGVAHELVCGTTLMTALYLFPLTGETQLLSRNFEVDLERVCLSLPIPLSVRHALLDLHGGDSARSDARQLLDATLLYGERAAVPCDPRIAKAVGLLSGDAGDLPLREIARQVGLSESRLTHLFRNVVGVPSKRYRLWQRMRRVTEHVAAGDNLTMAALGAGFADSAHLSHGFRAMFGVPASRILNDRARVRA